MNKILTILKTQSDSKLGLYKLRAMGFDLGVSSRVYSMGSKGAIKEYLECALWCYSSFKSESFLKF